MNLLDESIECSSCNEFIDTPVVLPCGHSICKYHVEEAEELLDNKTIECEKCHEKHEIPEKGFARNRALENLIEKEIHSIDLGDEYKTALDKSRRFEDLLEEFKLAKNDPESKIHSVISDLRNKIDLRREELKEEIDKEALAAVKKLDDFENECKSNLTSINAEFENHDDLFKSWTKRVGDWNQHLNTFKKNTNRWKKIIDESSSRLKRLQSEFLAFNRKLFLDRINEFNYSHLSISSDFNTLSVELKEVNNYIDVHEKKKRVAYAIAYVMGIEWQLVLNIEQSTKKSTKITDNYIGVYLFAIQNPVKIQAVKVEYDFVIVDQLGMNRNWIKGATNIFDSNLGHGFNNLIRLKDLVANYNLYNIGKDSCTIQAVIKKVEWI